MDKVSVVMPTYNRRDTLVRAVKSALNQTHSVHEILVCDDGSSDDSKQLVLGLGDARIKWIDCGRNGLPAVPRNIGIRRSEGDWVAFLDSDDEWQPCKMAVQLSAIHDHKKKAACSNAHWVLNGVRKGRYLSYRRRLITFSDLLKENYNICSSVVVDRTLLANISLFPESTQLRAYEDYALWLRLSAKTDFTYVADPLLCYFDTPQSSLRAAKRDIWDAKSLVLSDFISWMRENKIRLNWLDESRLRCVYDWVQKRGETVIWNRLIRKIIM